MQEGRRSRRAKALSSGAASTALCPAAMRCVGKGETDCWSEKFWDSEFYGMGHILWRITIETFFRMVSLVGLLAYLAKHLQRVETGMPSIYDTLGFNSKLTLEILYHSVFQCKNIVLRL